MTLDLTDYALPKFNKLRKGAVALAAHPAVVSELHPFIAGLVDPNKIGEASNHKLPWRCAQGHEWFAPIQKRAQKGTKCPECVDRKVTEGENDLASKYPKVAAEWDHEKNVGITPSNTAAGSHDLIHWKCTQGHEWSAKVYNRTTGGTNCPVCAGSKVATGFNDLRTTHPEVSSRVHPQNMELASMVSKGAHTEVQWLCSKGHTYISPVYNQTQGQGCGVCAGQVILKGFNDLETTHPELVASSWDYENNIVRPSEITYGSKTKVRWRCEDYGHEWAAVPYSRTGGNLTGCPECAGRMSKGEKALYDFVRSSVSKDTEVLRNYREVRSLSTGRVIELDVYLPESNVGIEYNGLFYHSEFYGKDRNYHLNKRKSVEAAGIRLITVWEDDWKYRPEVTKRALLSKLGVLKLDRVFARKLEVREIRNSEAFAFLDSNHIQGQAAGSIYLGAYYEGDLVAVMVLIRRETDVYELVRYATSCQVVGGHSKMISWVKKHTDISTLVTFADLDISDGSLYEKTGWVLDKELPPDYSYLVAGRRREHKFGYRLTRFKRDPDLKYEEGKTERELAELNNLYRVWDSGKKRYTIQLRGA